MRGLTVALVVAMWSASAALAGDIWGIPVTQGAAAGYVPGATCARCHGKIAESFAKVGMGRSFVRASADQVIETFTNAAYYHEPSDRYYRIELRGTDYWFTRHRLAADGTQMDRFEQRIDWIVGSGNHSRVYLYQTANGALYQLPLAWYSQSQSWAMAPGFEFAGHYGLQRLVRRRCMTCHNAYPDVPAGSERTGMPEVFPTDLPEGIGCQRCHGPGAKHVNDAIEREVLSTGLTNAALRQSIVNPANLNAEQQQSLCYSCHMQPSVAVPSALRLGREVFQFQPGEVLDAHMAQIDIVDANRARDERFDINHHPYRLEQSACFIQSEGALGCLSCHDPHNKVAPAERAAHYKAVCLDCHALDDGGAPVMASGAAHPDIAADADCTTCHMPERRTQDVIEVWMTDHKIQRGPIAGDPLARIEKELADVTEISIPNVPADMGTDEKIILQTMAILDHTGGRASYAADALIDVLTGNETPHFEPWLELAKALLRQRRYTDALQAAEQARRRAPDHPGPIKIAGLARQQLGDSEIARDLTVRSLQMAPEMAEQHLNLALIHVALGDEAAALKEARAALALQHTLWSAWRLIGEVEARAGNLTEAAEALETALTIEPTGARARAGLIEVLTRMGRTRDAARHRSLLPD